MKRIALLAGGFGYMVLLIEAVHAGVAWWHDEWGNRAGAISR